MVMTRSKYFPECIIDADNLVLPHDASAKCQFHNLLTASQLLTNHVHTRGSLVCDGPSDLIPAPQLG